ncbi:MAG: hypothetical protein ABSF10_14550 [Verrucomicrobiota bacterium]|jgi:hypothetical protein
MPISLTDPRWSELRSSYGDTEDVVAWLTKGVAGGSFTRNTRIAFGHANQLRNCELAHRELLKKFLIPLDNNRIATLIFVQRPELHRMSELVPRNYGVL